MLNVAFLSSSLTVSMSALFRSMILSCWFMREFLMFFLSLVTRCMSSMKSLSKRSWLMYPLSARIFLKSLCVKSLSFNGSRSSTFQGVSVHCFLSLHGRVSLYAACIRRNNPKYTFPLQLNTTSSCGCVHASCCMTSMVWSRLWIFPYIYNRDRTTLGRGGAGYGTVRGWASPLCRT